MTPRDMPSHPLVNESLRQRFEAALPRVRAMYDERFIRMWRFYLGYCEAGFRSGRTDVIQLAIGRD